VRIFSAYRSSHNSGDPELVADDDAVLLLLSSFSEYVLFEDEEEEDARNRSGKSLKR